MLQVFGIHPLTTEDIQMEETREKIELFRNYYLVCFRSFDQDQYSPTHLEPLNMYIIVFREGTLSFHFRPTPHPQNVRRRIKQLKDYISVTSDWISYALIDDITDAFGPLIQGIEYEVDSIDELVLILKEAEQTDMLRRIGTCRKKVMGLLRLMGNKADVVKGLAKRCNEHWRVAPTSDIVSSQTQHNTSFAHPALPGPVSLRHPGPSHHHDAESEPLREDPLALPLQLPRANFH
jgi:magnesium transporter